METTIDTTPAPVSTDSSTTPASGASERPATAQQAFAHVAAEMETEAAAQPDGATTPPAATTDPGAPPPSSTKQGPIPFDVHSKALENARTKASEEALAKHREQFGWAEQVDRAAVEQAQRLGQLYAQDRAGYVRQLLSEAAADPVLAPVVRSEAARMLAQGRGAQAPSFEPDIPVYDDKGQLVAQTFSAAKVQELIKHVVAEALGKELSPLKTDFESRQQREQAETLQRELQTFATTTYQEAVDVLPGFKEHEADISKVFLTLRGDDPAKDLRQAWKQVVGPTLKADAAKQVLDTFTKKQQAQTVDGSGKAASTPTRPRNPRELAAYMRSISE